MLIDLVRVAVGDEGAFGVLVKDRRPFAVTLERTYEPNDHIKIPGGKTTCRRSWFHRGGYETFEVEVAGHSRILFHRGNVEVESEGCILVGKSFGRLGGRAAILRSREGFDEFMAALSGVDGFEFRVSGGALT